MLSNIKKFVRRIYNVFSSHRELNYYKSIYKRFSSYTMVPKSHYTDNLYLANQCKAVGGGVVECGVWRGGMVAGIAKLLGGERKYYLFDSFEGLPEPELIDGKEALAWAKNTEGAWYHNNCKAEIEFAQSAMRISGVESYTCIKGWFNVTVPSYKFENEIALLRLDGDWYESTMICLQALYPQVAQGGYVIIDDYYAWDGCSRAVHDYLSSIKSESRIHQTKNRVAYIIKKG